MYVCEVSSYHREITVYQTQIVEHCVTWEGGKYLDLHLWQDPAQTLSGTDSSMVSFTNSCYGWDDRDFDHDALRITIWTAWRANGGRTDIPSSPGMSHTRAHILICKGI